MATPDLSACFGLEILGLCKYDPQAPSPSYFTIGDAVAALAFTLAVQQFLKPIYQFRLRAMGIRFSYVVCAVFLGALCTVVAAAVPNVPAVRGTVFGYPLNWEIAGGLIIGSAYAIVAIVALRGATVNNRNLPSFTWAGTKLLSEATDEDRLSFAQEILQEHNIQMLVYIASEFERAEAHAIRVEFEKLRERGVEKQGIRGKPPVSAFYAFARRRELERASYAWHFLQILSDRDFCRVIITRYSWGFLQAIIPLSEKDTYHDAARAFVQAVAWQALVQDEGMLAKEDGFGGFGRTRTFATEFFGNHRMRLFEPLNGTDTFADSYSKGFVSRLNIAAELMIKAEIKSRGFWDNRSTFSISHIYKNVFHNISYDRFKDKNIESITQLSFGIEKIIKIVESELEKCDLDTYRLLFTTTIEKHRTDSLDEIAELICEGLECVANRFKGVDDPAWSFALHLFGGVFERFGEIDKGLSPLQQVVAIRLIKKLKENMRGFYPTLSRVLLAIIGPYETRAQPNAGTAFAIIKEAVYREFTELPNFMKRTLKKWQNAFHPMSAMTTIKGP